MPVLTYPLAFFGLLAVPLLVWIYLLRTRYARRTVSSLLLWQQLAAPRQAGRRPRWQRLAPLFFLELLVVLLLIAAATSPIWPRRSVQPRLIVVLDDSASMHAGALAERPRSLALAKLSEFLQEKRQAGAELILAGAQAQRLGVLSEPVMHQLEAKWRCLASTADLQAGLRLAAELAMAYAAPTHIVVLTDQAPHPAQLPPDVTWLGFGQAQPNAAITAAFRASTERGERVVVELAALASAAPLNRTLLVEQGRGQPALRHEVCLTPAKPQRLEFVLPPTDAPLQLRLLPGDALASDDQALLLPEPRPRVRVELAMADESLAALVQRAIAVSDVAVPATGRPADLLITDQPHPNMTDHPEAWQLHLEAGTGAARGFAAPFLLDGTHPLLQGITLADMIWSRGELPQQDTAASGLPLVAAGNWPLLTEQRLAGDRRKLNMYFRPSASTLQESPDWPILFWNLLRWRAQYVEGPRQSCGRMDERIELAVAPANHQVRIRTPDGSERLLPVQSRHIRLHLQELGLYTVATGTGRYEVACNLFAAAESDLGSAASGCWRGSSSKVAADTAAIPLAPLLLLLVLTAVVLHMLLTSLPRRGISR